ncbi:hypothetical protein AMECASPLE_028719, partial [Ameca splendens]
CEADFLFLCLYCLLQQHCFRKCTGLIEQRCKLLIDGILGTLVIFLVLELLICITAMLFGLSVLAAGGSQERSKQRTKSWSSKRAEQSVNEQRQRTSREQRAQTNSYTAGCERRTKDR